VSLSFWKLRCLCLLLSPPLPAPRAWALALAGSAGSSYFLCCRYLVTSFLFLLAFSLTGRFAPHSSNQDIVAQSTVEITDRKLFDLNNDRAIVRHGPLDGRMGISNKTGTCETCGQSLQDCNGHFGHLKLTLPAFHVGYFKKTMTILQNICKDCSRVLLEEDQRRSFLRDLRRPHLDNLRKVGICKAINKQCRKTKACFYCGAINGIVKKAGNTALRIVHDQFASYNRSTSQKKVPPPAKVVFDQSFEEAKKGNGEIEKNMRKAFDDLNPLRVLKLFQQISASDCELLGMKPSEARPEMLIWQYVPAPPVCIRPSVGQENASTEDDITSKLGDIVQSNNYLKEALAKGAPVQSIMEQWDYLQLQIALYINSDVPGLLKSEYGKPIRGFVQRLKGKQGRFRGNLSGKRVDFSSRTVISPDPNLRIDEVAIPELVAKNMTYPEMVTIHNIEKLRKRVLNGHNIYPGANFVHKNNQKFRLMLKFATRPLVAEQLAPGDKVERHLEDGDIVLFNRQPSLHRLSIMAHFVRVRPHRTFRLNECVCTPYNADFDGDEMNMHVPQTEEARTEAVELMGVKHNLVTPKNGEPIIAAIQDFITAAYLMSKQDVFFDRKTFTNICLFMLESETPFDLPPPTIIKPETLWTGKQIFNVLMCPNRQSQIKVNLDAACREYKVIKDRLSHDLQPIDGWLTIRNSEIMCGVMDKSTIGSGKKDSVFYVLLRDFGPDAAANGMNRLSKLSARWLGSQGFSIGIDDVQPGIKLLALKQELVEKAYADSDDVIGRFQDGKLEKAPGCDEEQTMENEISGILSRVRQQAGDYCISELSHHNAPLIMAQSGSKGSSINVSQMVAVVGQQIIGGKRVEDGFQDRTLPHFPKNARQPPSKGFVCNSFYSGLSPSEFLFHAISGREGLVDTAVKTAETGYMSRRLMKALEDFSVQYDDTVRNSESTVVQFQYGDDRLDPLDMEGRAKPVHFDRTFTHTEAITWDNKERSLLPYEIMALCEELLAPRKARLVRKNLLGKVLDYHDRSSDGMDDKESERDFLQSVEDYVKLRADKLTTARVERSLSPGTERPAKRRKMKLDDSYLERTAILERTAKLSATTLRTFINTCLKKHDRAHVEPGHAVGAIGAQSIGEPGTQMTLKTFHFAGVAGMSITQGVPRIKEIINASKEISTPVITCELLNNTDVRAARLVKGRIEKTYLRDIIFWLDDGFSSDKGYIAMKVDFSTIAKLQLELTMKSIVHAIKSHKRIKTSKDLEILAFNTHIHIYVTPSPAGGKQRKTPAKDPDTGEPIEPVTTDIFYRLQSLKRFLPTLQICGHEATHRAIIKTDTPPPSSSLPPGTPAPLPKHTLLVEGLGLLRCLTTPGINPLSTTTNSITETHAVLGIEAARASIITEISSVMQDMDIDPRHYQLLADVMTYKGEVLGITRFGLAKMRDGVLQLASFEKTSDHLFEAAGQGKVDGLGGVSESVIMGRGMGIGTGGVGVVRETVVYGDVVGSQGEMALFDEVCGRRPKGQERMKR
jgi:DNA-directed RNA polymerase III subunit RPC1